MWPTMYYLSIGAFRANALSCRGCSAPISPALVRSGRPSPRLSGRSATRAALNGLRRNLAIIRRRRWSGCAGRARWPGKRSPIRRRIPARAQMLARCRPSVPDGPPSRHQVHRVAVYMRWQDRYTAGRADGGGHDPGAGDGTAPRGLAHSWRPRCTAVRVYPGLSRRTPPRYRPASAVGVRS